ncbi:MAG: 30S ribosomal protein S8 [Acidimicrobiales bacterium]|nr:30S ribosomal protein S8 [Acidimicrobiales bacterium]
MTDPIADMLTRIRNANMSMRPTVRMPGSKLKEALAEILVREGYIASYKRVTPDRGPGNILELSLKYSSSRERTIGGLKRVSKPGLRIYASADQIPRVLGGMGVAVLSTSKGLMTDAEARRSHVGGEVLCHVW